MPRFRVWYVSRARNVSSDSLCLGTGIGFGVLGGMVVASMCCLVCGSGHGSAFLNADVEKRRWRGRMERPESISLMVEGTQDHFRCRLHTAGFPRAPLLQPASLISIRCLSIPPPFPPPSPRCVPARRQVVVTPIPAVQQQTTIQALLPSRCAVLALCHTVAHRVNS